jgi:uncharacterized protein (TIGR02145 family)
MKTETYDELTARVMAIVKKDGGDAVFNYLDDCLGKNPNFVEAYLVRGEVCAQIGNLEEALDDFEKAIELDPKASQPYSHRGLLYAKSGDIDKAIDDFSTAIELDVSNAMAYSNRANMYLKKRELQKAINDCSKAIVLSPNSMEPYSNRALAYMNIGEFAKAFDDYNKVIIIAPENAEAYAKRGLLYSQQGDVQEAISDYEKFLQLDPGNRNAKLVRDELEKLKSGKPSDEDSMASPKAEFKRHRTIMIIGCVIGGFIGGVIGASANHSTTSTLGSLFVILIGILIGAFVGSGIGPWLHEVKKFLIRIPDGLASFIRDEKAEKGDSLESVFMGLGKGLLGAMIFGFFKLSWEGIKSPFIAINRLTVLYSSMKHTETYDTANEEEMSDEHEKPARKGIILAILAILAVIVIILWIATNKDKVEEVANKPEETATPKIEKPEVSTFMDSRDKKMYKSITLGSQTWMAENLNYSRGGKCYNDDPANCQKYGKHFNWAEAKKACPAGWHLPSNEEWDALYKFADGSGYTESPYKSETAGRHLKAAKGWNYFNEKPGNGEDAYGFAALPGGSYYFGVCDHVGNNGYWWSSSEYEDDSDKAYYRFMLSESTVAGWNKNSKTKLLLNVRCVKD